MIELRQLLHPYLKMLHPRVYYQVAPESAQYPYIVYDIPNIIDDGEGLQIAILDIDGWDMPINGNTIELENLMTNINNGINKETLTVENMAVSVYLDRKLSLTDNDKRICRRKYIYQARLFK